MSKLKETIRNGRTIKYAARLFLAVIIGLVLAGSLPAPVHAADPVDLVLGGEGATSWNIENIMPCDSGVKTITLHNAGTDEGFVTMWISDIVSSEGANPESETGDTSEPGELIDYLLFNLSSIPSNRLSTSLSFPAYLYNFPQSASGPGYIRIIPLNADETVTLNWEWELPCPTGNEVQGDSVSFTINYLLEEFPPPPPPPPPPPRGGGGGSACSFEINMLGEIVEIRVDCCNNSTTTYHIVYDPDDENFLTIDRGTPVICGDCVGCGSYPLLVEITEIEDFPPAPEGTEIIAAYDCTGYKGKKVCSHVTFGKPIVLLLRYDPDELPEGTSSVFIARYNSDLGMWEPLPPDTGRVAEVGEATGLISMFSTFAVVAELSPPAPPEPQPQPTPTPPEPTPPPSPAHFVASDLKVVPSLEKIGIWNALTFVVRMGESVTITVNVGNDGGQEGSYVANLNINGQTQDTKEITLHPGQGQELVFTTIENEPGHYVVQIGDLSGEFTTLLWVNWWLIGGLIAAFALLGWLAWYYGYYRRKHSR